jgi:hypothetical protein
MTQQPHILSPQEIEAASRALISARKTNLGIELQMPVVYPTGSAVTVVVTIQGGEYVVHDAGAGVMALTGAGITVSKTLQERLVSLAKHYGCEFIGGRMSRRCSPSQIALAAVMVANASRTVGDQALDAKRKPIAIFKREMADVVADVFGKRRVREEEAIKGASGTTYRVNAVVLDATETTPVAFVEAVTDDQSVNRHFREFYDLKRSPQYADVSRVGIYDSRRIWRPGDLAILDEVGQVIPYSNASVDLRGVAA